MSVVLSEIDADQLVVMFFGHLVYYNENVQNLGFSFPEDHIVYHMPMLCIGKHG